jgi:hypothetical protein
VFLRFAKVLTALCKLNHNFALWLQGDKRVKFHRKRRESFHSPALGDYRD